MTQHEASRLDKMEEKLTDLQESVEEIKTALLGSDYTGKGLIHKVNGMDGRISTLEKYVYMGMGVGTTIGVFYALIQLFK